MHFKLKLFSALTTEVAYSYKLLFTRTNVSELNTKIKENIKRIRKERIRQNNQRRLLWDQIIVPQQVTYMKISLWFVRFQPHISVIPTSNLKQKSADIFHSKSSWVYFKVQGSRFKVLLQGG